MTSTLSRQMKAPAVVIGSGVLVPCLANAYEVLGWHAIVDRRIVTSPPGSISVERIRGRTIAMGRLSAEEVEVRD